MTPGSTLMRSTQVDYQGATGLWGVFFEPVKEERTTKDTIHVKDEARSASEDRKQYP
jgi:hypothetical protein